MMKRGAHAPKTSKTTVPPERKKGRRSLTEDAELDNQVEYSALLLLVQMLRNTCAYLSAYVEPNDGLYFNPPIKRSTIEHPCCWLVVCFFHSLHVLRGLRLDGVNCLNRITKNHPCDDFGEKHVIA
jgi:hypothetical protein